METLILGLFAAAGFITSIYLLATRNKTEKKEIPAEEIKTPIIDPRIAETLTHAEEKARGVIHEAEVKASAIKREAENEGRQIREKVVDLERRLESRQSAIDQRMIQLEKMEADWLKKSEELTAKVEATEKSRREIIEKLETISGLTREEAKKEILKQTETIARDDMARVIREAEMEAEDKADLRGRDILVSAMQRGATDYVAEFTTAKVKLPDEDFKGRIIGREGRNIKAFEKAAGVAVDMDETSGEIRISSFDGVRREIARVALERLIADGRIQPARIEAEVEKARTDLDRDLRKVGEKLVYDAGVSGIPPELLPLLGCYKFRTSYGQSLLQHSLEVANIGKIIAAEVGADIPLVKKACLLHDLGKVKTAEMEGPHAELTRRLLSKYNFDEKLINAAAAHHEEEEFKSLEAVIVHIADAISGARPGARFEDYEAYIQRMHRLEDIALSFEEAKEAYALSAGREIRVIVRPEKSDDTTVTLLSQKIAKKIEAEETYPGQVKITVIREVRASGTAK